VKGIDADEFARISSENALRIFGKMAHPVPRATAA
jgi:hypothetical protein